MVLKVPVGKAALAAASIILASSATTAVTRHQESPPTICSCDPHPVPRPLPSAEALGLARRIVLAVDDPVIWARVNALVDVAERRAKPIEEPPPNPRLIQAAPAIRPSRHPIWETQLHDRLVDHAALIYAWRYPVEELRQDALYFESAAGARFLADRAPVASAFGEELRTREVDDDLWNIVCGTPLPTGPDRGPHALGRLHAGLNASAHESRPPWCPMPRSGQP